MVKSIHVIIFFVLSILVVLGVAVSQDKIFQSGDDTVQGADKNQSNFLDCVMVNKDDAVEDCKDNSDYVSKGVSNASAA